jgi:hypothetical protein
VLENKSDCPAQQGNYQPTVEQYRSHLYDVAINELRSVIQVKDEQSEP